MKKFNIDFFSLSFLIEACLPPNDDKVKQKFFKKAISKYSLEMSNNQKQQLLTWLRLNDNFDVIQNKSCADLELRYSMMSPKEPKFSNSFVVNFDEFCILTEACIPTRPIARTMFFNKISDYYYNVFDDMQKEQMFNVVTKNKNFNIKDDDSAHFVARFSKDNQYKITTVYKGEIGVKLTYKLLERYHIDRITSILEEYITNIEKL